MTVYPIESERSPIPFIPEPYWCIHHEVLIEWTREPIENRVRFIKENKRPNEIPIRLMSLVKVKNVDRIPEVYKKAHAHAHAYDNANAYAYANASSIDKTALIALHKEECPNTDFDYERSTLVFPT